MRAIVLEAYGDNSRLHPREWVEPQPGPGQVAIRVHAAGIAIWDALVREGTFPLPSRPPLVPGFEGAGVIEAVGSGVDAWKAGDAVWSASYDGSGFWAERAVVAAAECAPLPRPFGFEEACGLGIAGLTAYMAMVETLAVASGETVLVAGAAGGVGTLAVQVAKHAGARVIGTAGAANAAYLASIGVDHVVDYTTGDVPAQVRALVPAGVDAALDAVNGNNARETVKAVRSGGRIAIVTEPDLEPDDRSIAVTRIRSNPTAARLAALTQLANDGALRVVLDAHFTLDTIPDGLAYVERGHKRGKVVATIVP